MANSVYDFAPGKFALLEVGDDGPSRLEGHTTYDSMEEAEKAAESFLRDSYAGRRVTIFEAHFTYHVDPRPKILDNKPKAK